MDTDVNKRTTSALQHSSSDQPSGFHNDAQAELIEAQAQPEHLQPAATAEQAGIPADIALQPADAEADAAPAGPELHQPGPPHTEQAPATPAVRTLDDIMSEYESPKHHDPGPELPVHPPPAAPAQPSLHSTEHSAAQGVRGSPADQVPRQGQAEVALAAQGAADEAVGAHAAGPGHDEHMPDASPTGLQHGLPAETPGMAPLPSKESTIGGAARRQEIKPESDAGSVIWAKTKGYPWWPAQVLAVDDPWIPPDMEIPRRGAVPVRFFGTYNFTWIESQRNLMPYDIGCQEDLASKGTQKAFMDGLQEVQAYLKTGVTPPGFSVMPISPEQAPEEAAAKMGKRPGSSKARDDPSGGPGISKDAGKMAAARKKEAEKAAAARAAALQRKQRALKKLGLVAPRNSPFKEGPCLDAARTWFAQALVEEQARQQRMQEQQRQMEERQKLQQQLFQRQLATQMLHQQQLLQRAAAQQAQHGQQPETIPSVWRASQAMSNAPAASPAVQWQPQQPYSQTQQNGQMPGQQASEQGQH